MSPWSPWRAHFEANAHRPRPLLPVEPDLPETVRQPLVRTLAVFQRGEVGEGRIAHEVRKARIHGLDEDYYQALSLFVREEGRHAVQLATAVRSLGGTPLESAWAEKVFHVARRAVDVRHELVVLLAAEVVAVVFYGALARGLAPSPLADVLADLVRDEHDHLDFHMDFFRRTLGGSAIAQAAWRARWWAIGSAACGTVIVDHGATFKALGIGRRELAREVRDTLARVDRRVCGGADVLGPSAGAPAPGQAGLEPATPSTKNWCSAS